MKKIAFIIVFLCLSTVVSGKVKNDTLAAYRALITKIMTSPRRKIVNIKTSTSKSVSFNNFEFLVDLDYRGAAIRAKENWKDFINQIDTATIKDFKLATMGKPWFEKINTKANTTLTFSPIVLNSEKNLALINVVFDDEYDLFEITYYLERGGDGTWKVIHSWMNWQT